MKLISFSGAQSTGKTTLLNKLQDLNYDQSYVTFVPEVTRVVGREYNLPINEDGGGLTQLLIIAHHVENVYRKEPTHIETKVLDRCILDGLVYTNFLSNHHNFDSILSNVKDAAGAVFLKTICQYDVIFHTSPTGICIENDGVRSINEQFRNNIIELFDQYILSAKTIGANIVTLEGTVEERLEQIKQAVDRLDIKLKV